MVDLGAGARHASSIKAGFAYFAATFAAGFMLGTVRVLFVVPQIGETAAVLIELPIMLAVSWLLSWWLVDRFRVPPAITARMIMGGLAFGLLMFCELGVSAFVFDRSVAEHLARYAEASGLLGLIGQLAFAAIPTIQLVVRR